MGDPYSSDAAKAFELAANDNQIDVCTKANYEAGSLDMGTPIKQIMDNKCCLVTVVFGQTQDLSSLLLEAHRQNYAGEWIMGDNIVGSLDTIVNDLNKHLDESATHKLLRGMFELPLTKAWSHIDNNFRTCEASLNHTLHHFLFRHIYVVNQTSQK